MKYTEQTSGYNERRYGRPWRGIVTGNLTKDFVFVDWEGRPGQPGVFEYEAEPGTIVAYGQKDLRKGRGGVDGYDICMPDGSILALPNPMEYKKLTPEARWRKKAEERLAYWLAVQPTKKAWDNAPVAEPNPEFSQRGKKVALYAGMLWKIRSCGRLRMITMEAFGL